MAAGQGSQLSRRAAHQGHAHRRHPALTRVRDGITLRRAGDFLLDGSYLAEISGSGIALTVRVIEYQVTVAGRDAPELFCLIPDLHDHAAYPARQLAQAYHWRWIGSETCLKETKSAIRGAGPMLCSGSPPLVRQEHADWVIAVELARAAAAVAIPAHRGRHAAARRAVITFVRTGAATASLAAAPAAAKPGTILGALARRRVQVDRCRHRDRKTKARPGFPPGGPRLPPAPRQPRSASTGP